MSATATELLSEDRSLWSKQPPGRIPGEAIADKALLALGRDLKESGYRFTAITPNTHNLVHGRATKRRSNRNDIFGWSRPFSRGDLPARYIERLADAGELECNQGEFRSRVRFATIDDLIFVHSAFPTRTPDAVFFGPDTYRFVRLIRRSIPTALSDGCRILDIGAGSGAGGLFAAALVARSQPSLLLTDINDRALRYSGINAAINSIAAAEIAESNLFGKISGKFDLILSNPPYLVDPLKRLYRHGGGAFGSQLSLQIIKQAIPHLRPGGRLILYTGSSIVDGVDLLQEAFKPLLERNDLRATYEEIDVDVFGEELANWPYRRVDRIAAVGLVVERLC
jgi:methylase of polypeptide subunit release factors